MHKIKLSDIILIAALLITEWFVLTIFSGCSSVKKGYTATTQKKDSVVKDTSAFVKKNVFDTAGKKVEIISDEETTVIEFLEKLNKEPLVDSAYIANHKGELSTGVITYTTDPVDYFWRPDIKKITVTKKHFSQKTDSSVKHTQDTTSNTQSHTAAVKTEVKEVVKTKTKYSWSWLLIAAIIAACYAVYKFRRKLFA